MYKLSSAILNFRNVIQLFKIIFYTDGRIRHFYRARRRNEISFLFFSNLYIYSILISDRSCVTNLWDVSDWCGTIKYLFPVEKEFGKRRYLSCRLPLDT